jgi:hypothetical protein
MKKIICLMLSLVLMMTAFPLVSMAQITADGLVYRIDDDEVAVIIGYEGTAAEYTIPATLEDLPVIAVENEAFYECSTLKKITLPDSLKTIGNNAFAYCDGLTEMVIPAGVTDIASNAFAYCENLTKVSLGSHVSTIGNLAFFQCAKLSTISVAEENSTFSSLDGMLTNKDQTQIVIYPAGKSEVEVFLPQGITAIGDYAFHDNEWMNELTLPDTLISIGHYAFYGTHNLIEVTIPYQVKQIGENAFNGNTIYTIFGYSGSVAHGYATDKNIRFVSLGESPVEPSNPNENPTPDTPSDNPHEQLEKGDVDDDNVINATDALLALQVAVGKKQITLPQQIAADVNGDGKLDAVDALLILQYAVGKIKEFPV